MGFKKLKLSYCMRKNRLIQQPVDFTSVHASIVLGQGVY
jgi:hypothetical protein